MPAAILKWFEKMIASVTISPTGGHDRYMYEFLD